MAITQTAHLVSAHLWFFPTGLATTLPSVSTASSTFRPAHEPAIANPTTAASIDPAWLDLGAVESIKMQSKAGADVKVYGALPGSGVKTIKKILKGMIERTFAAVLAEWSPFALGLFFRSATPTLTGTNSEYNALTPDSQAQQEGWLYFEGYDASSATEMLVRGYSWGVMEISGDGETDTNKNWSFSVTHTQELSTLNEVIAENV